mgnify:CR=1 FL=1
MRFFIIFFFFTNSVVADQGINIFCLNMKNLLKKDPEISKFKFDVTTFQYFDHKKNSFIEIPNKNLIIKKDSFAARFNNYDLIFEINEFEGRSPLMSMSKYDYKNNKFLDDYFCDVKTSNIN